MTIEKSQLVQIRDGTSSDRNFIFATFLRGLYYGETWLREIPKNIFMESYHKILEVVLNRPNTIIKVCCLKEDPEVILGYSIYHKINDSNVLDWVFVKSAWRNIGIAKSLVPENLVAVTHLTKTGKALMSKVPNLIFNPFIL